MRDLDDRIDRWVAAGLIDPETDDVFPKYQDDYELAKPKAASAATQAA